MKKVIKLASKIKKLFTSNNKSIKRILFISHDGSLTGAPIILLNIFKWHYFENKKNDTIFDILFLKNGAIVNDFKELNSNIYILPEKNNFSFDNEKLLSIFDNLFFTFSYYINYKILILNLKSNHYKLIYANTTVSLNYSIFLKKIINKNLSIICHCHELKCVIKKSVPDFYNLSKEVYKFIAVSQMVKDVLVKDYQIEENKINLIYEFSDKINNELNPKLETINKKFIVGASGFVHWRKGYDIFIQVARLLFELRPTDNIEFMWVGELDDLHNIVIINDLSNLNLMSKVHFVGIKNDPISFFNNFDIFILPSREDPFPLVCIEVALLGKPIICFEKATGISEVICEGGGYVVPYLNIEKMVEKILFYHDNISKLECDSLKVKKLFEQFNSENSCSMIYDTIQNSIK
jgi:glycosyltransferase involved in cell wall biosynthesis